MLKKQIKRVPGSQSAIRTTRQFWQGLLLGPGWPIQRRRLKYHPQMSLSKFVATALGVGDVALDIGANVGNTAQLMAACVAESGRVYAFEPNPLCFKQLDKCAKNAWHHNLRAYPIALSDINGSLTLFEDLREGGVASTIVAKHAERETALHGAEYVPTSVVATTLDTFFCDEIPDCVPTFLKIDVEGAESGVIRGGAEVIASHCPLIWFECWCGLESGMQINQDLDHIEFLSKIGYTFFLATIFELNGKWIPGNSPICPATLLPFEPQMLETIPAIGCDILAVTPNHLGRLQNLGLVSKSTARHHLLEFAHGK